jgi:hypothetical protein
MIFCTGFTRSKRDLHSMCSLLYYYFLPHVKSSASLLGLMSLLVLGVPLALSYASGVYVM